MKQLHSDSNARLRALLKKKRIEAGLTQQELSDLLGRDRNFVSTVELGTRKLEVLEFAEYCKALRSRPPAVLGQVLRPGKITPVVGRVRKKKALKR